MPCGALEALDLRGLAAEKSHGLSSLGYTEKLADRGRAFMGCPIELNLDEAHNATAYGNDRHRIPTERYGNEQASPKGM